MCGCFSSTCTHPKCPRAHAINRAVVPLDAYLTVEHLSQLGRTITSMRTQTIARFGNSLTMRTRSALHERGVAQQLQAWKIDQEVHGRSITDDRVRGLALPVLLAGRVSWRLPA